MLKKMLPGFVPVQRRRLSRRKKSPSPPPPTKLQLQERKIRQQHGRLNEERPLPTALRQEEAGRKDTAQLLRQQVYLLLNQFQYFSIKYFCD